MSVGPSLLDTWYRVMANLPECGLACVGCGEGFLEYRNKVWSRRVTSDAFHVGGGRACMRRRKDEM